MQADANRRAKIVAVVVTYEPDATVEAEVNALVRQVAGIVIVDNGSSDEARERLRRLEGRAQLELLAENRGIGAAHNIGIGRARELGATHVMLMDQDSIPAEDMVAVMLEAETNLLAEGRKVGALGPVFHDTRVGKSWPFYRISRFGVRAERCDGRSYVPCDLLITSGTLVRVGVMDVVGTMNEAYFLEHVDTEWSLRARFKGYSLHGVCHAGMEHRLGDSTTPLPLSRRRVQIYSPYRHYYLFRNALLLWREPHASSGWKMNEIKRLLYRMLFFPFFVPPRLKRLKFMLLGLRDGIAGRTGPLKTR